MSKLKERLISKEKTLLEAVPNYEELYKKALAELDTLKTKYEELEKMCKSYATIAEQSKQALQKATVEYSGRTNYMLDCVRHAYVSMQFAQHSAEKKGE